MRRERSSLPRERSSVRRERASRRRERALVRRRLATAPPAYLSVGLAEDQDEDGPLRAEDSPGAAGDRSGQRRTRLRLALASAPLAVAVVLFTVTGLGSAPSAETTPEPVTAEDAGAGRSLPAPTLTAEAADGAQPPITEETSWPGADSPGAGRGTVRTPGQATGQGDHTPAVPVAPPGRRPVAVGIADPAALALVTVGDEVDVIGMDGRVLAEGLEVLQDRSSGTGSVLVLAVPDGASAPLAAAALSREVTVILSPGSSEQAEAEEEDAEETGSERGPETGP